MKSKTTATILGSIFGLAGAHLFYLGKIKRAFIYLFVFLISVVMLPAYGLGFFPMGILGIFVIIDVVSFVKMDSEKFNERYYKI